MAINQMAVSTINPTTTLMHREAGEGGDAVARFLEANASTLTRIAERLRAHPPKGVTTCARGSSDHAATYGKYLIETLIGVPTSTAALSVASIYDAPVMAADSLCIAISQSGRSPDLLTSVKAHKDSGAFVVALVNDFTSPLAELADEALPLCAGPELSVAATKSYIVSLAGLAALVAEWAGDDGLKASVYALPDQLRAAFARDWSHALPTLEDATNLFVIGRGYGFGIAQEAALKLKETCALHAEAFSSAEVRHGPMAIVREGFPILAFATSDTAGDGVREVAAEFLSRGAKVELADAGGGATSTLPAGRFEPALEPILMIQSFYRFANALSLRRGLNPDAPPHLNKVTRTV
jgi:glucosamine--fructose-6-phosphate aminotransferase (isomerizing)